MKPVATPRRLFMTARAWATSAVLSALQAIRLGPAVAGGLKHGPDLGVEGRSARKQAFEDRAADSEGPGAAAGEQLDLFLCLNRAGGDHRSSRGVGNCRSQRLGVGGWVPVGEQVQAMNAVQR